MNTKTHGGNYGKAPSQQGPLAFARRLLARQKELEIEANRLGTQVRNLGYLVEEAYELAGYERRDDGSFGPKADSRGAQDSA